MLTLPLKTTRTILINNSNNLFQQHSADQRRPRQCDSCDSCDSSFLKHIHVHAHERVLETSVTAVTCVTGVPRVSL